MEEVTLHNAGKFNVVGSGGRTLAARFFFNLDRNADKEDRCAMVLTKEGVRLVLGGEGESGVTTGEVLFQPLSSRSD